MYLHGIHSPFINLKESSLSDLYLRDTDSLSDLCFTD